MSDFDKITLDDLGVQFQDFDSVVIDDQLQTNLAFGPTKDQIKSFKNWDGCDGKNFFPYNESDRVGKLSDFVTAANLAAKEKEREAEKALENQKKKGLKAKSKEESKGIAEEDEEDEEPEDDDDMGFTTVSDARKAVKRGDKKGQNWQ